MCVQPHTGVFRQYEAVCKVLLVQNLRRKQRKTGCRLVSATSYTLNTVVFTYAQSFGSVLVRSHSGSASCKHVLLCSLHQ